jgi:squalene synthase HpnC
MTVNHYENFPVASALLPARLRKPVALIYRFAREADDFADEGEIEPGERLQNLETFRREVARIKAGAAPAIAWFGDLAAVIEQHSLPVSAFDDLLSAFSQDVVQSRYDTYDALLDYCRRSANPVGRLLLALYGARERSCATWSDAICTSLQLINFLQDVAIDFKKGRIYLPLDEMAKFGVPEQQIARGKVDTRWRGLMGFQVERARALLESGAPLGRALPGRIGLELRMIIAGGLRILEKIERVDFDVFRKRPVLRTFDWPLMLAGALR